LHCEGYLGDFLKPVTFSYIPWILRKSVENSIGY
jgi:hypothetical protein